MGDARTWIEVVRDIIQFQISKISKGVGCICFACSEAKEIDRSIFGMRSKSYTILFSSKGE